MLTLLKGQALSEAETDMYEHLKTAVLVYISPDTTKERHPSLEFVHAAKT